MYPSHSTKADILSYSGEPCVLSSHSISLPYTEEIEMDCWKDVLDAVSQLTLKRTWAPPAQPSQFLPPLLPPQRAFTNISVGTLV